MKKIMLIFAVVITIITACFILQSCRKNANTTTFGIYSPVYKTSSEVRSQIKSSSAIKPSVIGKIYVKDNYLFIISPNKGIHIFDNSNPAKPINKAFVNIPGCEDMAVFGNTMYADCYTDLIVLDIANPQQVIFRNYKANIFPDRNIVHGKLVDSGLVIVDWQKIKDTTVSNNSYVYNGFYNGFWYDAPQYSGSGIYFSAVSNSTDKSSGTGGSTSRFAIQNQTLYTVTTSTLNVLELVNPEQPNFIKAVSFGSGIETIFPFQDKLFIGSTTGMQIFDVSNAANPIYTGVFWHGRSCDPVIADDHYAYVTLRGGGFCGGANNELDILDIADIYHPQLLKTIVLTSPRGLAKNGNTLVVCDGASGLKVFNAANPVNPILNQTFKMNETSDVIINGSNVIVSAADGLYQFTQNTNYLYQRSKIAM